MQSIYIIITTIIVKNKKINKITDSVKYDFSELQIIQTHGNTWGLRDLVVTLVAGELKISAFSLQVEFHLIPFLHQC